MSDREEFEKWAKSKGLPVPSIYNSHTMQDIQQAWTAWQALQPEIDAIKDRVKELEELVAKGAYWEFSELKAENERLRKDAERYAHLLENAVIEWEPGDGIALVIPEPDTGVDWKAATSASIDAAMKETK